MVLSYFVSYHYLRVMHPLCACCTKTFHLRHRHPKHQIRLRLPRPTCSRSSESSEIKSSLDLGSDDVHARLESTPVFDIEFILFKMKLLGFQNV